jgi:hypothetical protein
MDKGVHVVTKAGNLLREAKALIADPKDWTQEGVYKTPEGCLCSAGAITKAVVLSNTAFSVTNDACDAIKECVRNLTPYLNITTYNDRPSTTHADIMNLFDAAIVLADERKTLDSNSK